MSKVEAQPFRIDKDNLIRVRIYITHMECQGISIQFKNSDQIEIVSTSSGSILGNEVKIASVPEYVQIFITGSNSKDYECLISYLNGTSLIHSESVTFTMDKTATISPSPTEIASIKGDGNNWNIREKHFKEVVQGRRQSSLWQVFLSCTNDIIVTVKTRSNKRCFMTFGAESDIVLHSDFLFPVDPDVKKIVIPAEAFWINYGKYNLKYSQVACFELIKPDFISIGNVFYKRKISNWLNVEDIPKIKSSTIGSFKTPTGNSLGDEWFISTESGLPIYKG